MSSVDGHSPQASPSCLYGPKANQAVCRGQSWPYLSTQTPSFLYREPFSKCISMFKKSRYTKKYAVYHCLCLAVTAGTWTTGTEVEGDSSAPGNDRRMVYSVCHSYRKVHVPSHREVCLYLHLCSEAVATVCLIPLLSLTHNVTAVVQRANWKSYVYSIILSYAYDLVTRPHKCLQRNTKL